jgi:lipoprotein-anchoring transpeptidase ErfK/SrfK
MSGGWRRLAIAAALACGSLLAPSGAEARRTVPFTAEGFRPGSIVIRDRERALYFLAGNGRAYRYPVAVGRRGKQWYGSAYVKGKYVNPAWSPPADVRRDKPNLPAVIPGGSPRNPMGPRAIMLDREEIAIHGTNRPGSIGTFASYGCIRMRNADILDLYERVGVGTQVTVTP